MDIVVQAIGAYWQSALWISFVLLTGLVAVSLAIGGAVMAVWIVWEKRYGPRPLPPFTLIPTYPRGDAPSTVVERFRSVRTLVCTEPEADEDTYEQEALPF